MRKWIGEQTVILEQEMMESKAKEIQEQINKELFEDLMTGVLTKDGWTQTNINPAFGKSHLVAEIDWYSRTAEWIHLNAKGDYKLMKGQWLFENSKDATMFILRWS
jgi:hypothetical protein